MSRVTAGALGEYIEIVDEPNSRRAVGVQNVVQRIVPREREHDRFLDVVLGPILLRVGAVRVESVHEVDKHVRHIAAAVHVRDLRPVCLEKRENTDVSVPFHRGAGAGQTQSYGRHARAGAGAPAGGHKRGAVRRGTGRTGPDTQKVKAQVACLEEKKNRTMQVGTHHSEAVDEIALVVCE